MSKPDYLSREPLKISHGKGKNFRKFQSRSKDSEYNRERFDYQKLSFDCVGDLAFWLDLAAQFLRVNKGARLFGGSSHSGPRVVMKYDMGPNYKKEGTSFPVGNPERRKTPKGESGGIELRVNEQTKMLFEKNRELQEEIAKRKVAEERIRAVLSEKDLLLQEVQHRLKNNL